MDLMFYNENRCFLFLEKSLQSLGGRAVKCFKKVKSAKSTKKIIGFCEKILKKDLLNLAK